VAAYSDLLKDPRWQKKRLEVLEAAGWSCERCGDKTRTLHVHHKKYRRGADPWEYDREELQSLCEPCHVEVTELDRGISACRLFVECERLGVTLKLREDGGITLCAPLSHGGKMEPEVLAMADEIRRFKKSLVAVLRNFGCQCDPADRKK
jgi:hypothetical protein